MIGMINDREFGVSLLEANVTDNEEEGSSTLEAHLDNIPPSLGEWPRAGIFRMASHTKPAPTARFLSTLWHITNGPK